MEYRHKRPVLQHVDVENAQQTKDFWLLDFHNEQVNSNLYLQGKHAKTLILHSRMASDKIQSVSFFELVCHTFSSLSMSLTCTTTCLTFRADGHLLVLVFLSYTNRNV